MVLPSFVGGESVCSLMLVPSFSLRLLLTCTAGVRTLSLPLSCSLTARTASLSVRVPTLTLSSPTSTTLATPTLVSTATLSPFALRSTSHLVLATSPELTTPLFSLSFLTTLLPTRTLPRFACMPPTTMYSVS